MSSVNQLTVIFLGLQGCGKGTHLKLLQEELKKLDTRDSIIFEAGRSLRELAAAVGYTPTLVHDAIERGELLPLFLSTRAFSESMIHDMRPDVHLMLDGFPRSSDQLPVLDSAIKFYKRTNPIVIHLDISEEEAIKRLTKRNRSDDTASGIAKRLHWTKEQFGGIESWFKNNPAYTFVTIPGERSIEDVHQDILKTLGLS